MLIGKPTYKQIKKLFKYNGKNLIWDIIQPGINKGDIAGHIATNGYRYIGINYKLHRSHRLIWLYHHGYLPENDIDHINRNPNDDRLENLREISHSCNIRNCGNFKNNTSGIKGVYFYKAQKIWISNICHLKKQHYLGSSKDFDEAVLLRFAAEQCLDWESCDTMSPAHKYAIENNLFKSGD